MQRAQLSNELRDQLDNAVSVLHAGGVIAYPTEYCFGLGCDPRRADAIKKLLAIKHRQPDQGLILIAANEEQIYLYGELKSLAKYPEIQASWPGPHTWLLPAHAHVSEWVRGKFANVAMRIPDHQFCLAMCEQFSHPIVSTSANRHGQPAHLGAEAVMEDMGAEVDLVVSAQVGGAAKASTIRNAATGEVLR